VSRQLFLASATMYDAWAMYDAKAKPVAIDAALRHPAADDTDANKRAAVAYAAYSIATRLFGTYETNTGAFARLLNQEGYGVNDTADPSLPAGIGNLACKANVELRANDGSNEANNY